MSRHISSTYRYHAGANAALLLAILVGLLYSWAALPAAIVAFAVCFGGAVVVAAREYAGGDTPTPPAS